MLRVRLNTENGASRCSLLWLQVASAMKDLRKTLQLLKPIQIHRFVFGLSVILANLRN